jgi:hypothetical protein
MKAGDTVLVTRVADPEYNTRWAARIGTTGVIAYHSFKTDDGWVVDFLDDSEDQFMEFKEDELEIVDGDR